MLLTPLSPWGLNDPIILIVTQVNCLDFKIFIYPPSLSPPSLLLSHLPPFSVCVCETAHIWRSEDSLQESVLAFTMWVTRD